MRKKATPTNECHYLCRDYCIDGKGYDPKTCPLKGREEQVVEGEWQDSSGGWNDKV